MGAGASSMNRLRKALLMRAYNIRSSDETLEEQFRKHAYRKEDKLFISVESVKDALSADAPWVDELFQRAMGGSVSKYLVSGKANMLSQPLPPGKNVHASKEKFMKAFDGRVNTNPPQTRRKPMPPTPPNKTPPRSFRRTDSFSRYIPAFDPEYSTLYPGVVRALGLHTLAEGIHSGTVVRSEGLGIALNPQDAHRTGGPTKPLWRKREIVKQERIIQYTTVDESGNTQELVEKETSQTEVLHMECRSTGEFAHRETTDYEHMETFNNEVVHEQTGKEEYVHLKSLEDEFEYMESNMPKKEAPPEPEEETPDELDSPDGQGGPFPFVDVDGADGEGRSYEDEDGGRMPTSKGLGAKSGSKRSLYTDEFEGGGASPGSGMWQSMGGHGWVPPTSSEDAQHGQPISFSDDEGSPPFARYQEPAGRRRPDLFAAEGSSVADRGGDADDKYSGEKDDDGVEISRADSDVEEGEYKKAYQGKSRGSRLSGGSKELSSDDFMGPEDRKEAEDKILRKIIAEAKEIARREKEEQDRIKGIRTKCPDEKVYVAADDLDEEGRNSPVGRWGTEDDID